MTVNDLRQRCHQYMKVKPEESERYEEFWKLNTYFAGGYDSRKDFELLNQEIERHEPNSSIANRLFYLALPPSVFEAVTVNLKNTCLAKR